MGHDPDIQVAAARGATKLSCALRNRRVESPSGRIGDSAVDIRTARKGLEKLAGNEVFFGGPSGFFSIILNLRQRDDLLADASARGPLCVEQALRRKQVLECLRRTVTLGFAKP
jgi:hypothetical protein